MAAEKESLHSFSNSYKLPRSEGENLRLSSQHYCLIRRQGWLIHPKIADALSDIENPQIADVACGTGVWGFDAADKHPNSTVAGLDISDAQFPAQWTWPKNVTLGLLDLSAPVPEEHKHKYDLVHCRLLVQAGPNMDPVTWLRAFESLLKPGGWLQWEEPTNPSFVRISKTDSQSPPVIFPTTANILRLEFKSGFIREFDTWIREHSSLQDAAKIQVPINPSILKLENDLIRRVGFDMNERMQQVAELDEKTKKQLAWEIVGQMEEINRLGDLTAFNWYVGLARAP